MGHGCRVVWDCICCMEHGGYGRVDGVMLNMEHDMKMGWGWLDIGWRMVGGCMEYIAWIMVDDEVLWNMEQELWMIWSSGLRAYNVLFSSVMSTHIMPPAELDRPPRHQRPGERWPITAHGTTQLVATCPVTWHTNQPITSHHQERTLKSGHNWPIRRLTIYISQPITALHIMDTPLCVRPTMDIIDWMV